MKHKPIKGNPMSIAKASKGMGTSKMPKFGKGNFSNAPKRHVMNKLKK